MIKAYFEDIKTHIIEELKKANSSIIVCVAWFTDNDLFEILCQKAKKGVNVELIIANDEINIKSYIDYDRINQCGGYFSFDSNNNPNSLMHNKFCVIDLNKTITGSYNWSYKAQNNRENITITSDSLLAMQFAKQFYNLKHGYFGSFKNLTETENNNIGAYLKRILKLIEQGNFNKIESELFIVRNLDYSNDDIKFIIILLTNKQWKSAELSINEYLKQNQQIVLYEDIEIKTLLFQKESLELKFDKLLIEKNDIEKTIFQFNIEYSQKLGMVLLELSKLKSKYNLGYNGAFGETKESINEALNIKISELNNLDLSEIKALYKKAAIICHPDKVDKEVQKEAEETFKQLNTAYMNNDIEEVQRIYNNLKSNNFFEKGKIQNKKSIIIREINRFVLKIENINLEINKLKITPSYQITQKVFDWELFYKLEEEKIKTEINNIKNEFSKKIFFKKRNR